MSSVCLAPVFGRDGTGVLGGRDIGGTGAQVAKDGDAPFSNHFRGDLMNRGQHAANATRRGVVRHRAIGNGEVSLLEEPVTVHLESDVLHPGGRTAVKRRIDQRTYHVPDFRPAFVRRLPQRPGCFVARNGR